jgi:hypothetical protein
MNRYSILLHKSPPPEPPAQTTYTAPGVKLPVFQYTGSFPPYSASSRHLENAMQQIRRQVLQEVSANLVFSQQENNYQGLTTIRVTSPQREFAMTLTRESMYHMENEYGRVPYR